MINQAYTNYSHVLKSLESHLSRVEAELNEINKDIELNERMKRKYNCNAFDKGSVHLKKLKENKELSLNRIKSRIHEMKKTIKSGKKLVSNFNMQPPKKQLMDSTVCQMENLSEPIHQIENYIEDETRIITDSPILAHKHSSM